MVDSFQDGARILKTVQDEMKRGIIGQAGLVEGLLTGILTDGHVLVEGVPGLAKTRAVNLLARICDASFRRLQFTPDLLPADIIGTQIYSQATGKFEAKPGPVFANFILADEINRAPAKVQSALLEAMQEKQVTIGEQTHPLPRPFLVFATQNPIEQEGTYPLPEAQVDRFLMKLFVGYPSDEEEMAIVRMVIQETELPQVRRLLGTDTIFELQGLVRRVHIEDKLVAYIKDLVFATRAPARFGLDLGPLIEYGASPRGSIALAQAARALALMDGRGEVMPEDVKDTAFNVLRHRIIMTYHARAEGVRPENVIETVLQRVKVP